MSIEQTPPGPATSARIAYALAHSAALLLIVAAIWVVYRPALDHSFGADQIDYLINTFGHYTTWDIFGHTYSYNRTRLVGAGDTMCFRPLFFAWLAWQQAWYESNSTAWQATSIVLHCLVCYQLFRLLRLAARNRGDSPAKLLLAIAIALFFAVNPNGIVMVVWAHIGAYLVFLLCVLVALELLIREAIGQGNRRSSTFLRLGAAWLLICAATFTYELGQFLALMAGLFLLLVWRSRGRIRAAVACLLAFASIAVLYQVVNAIDQRMHAGQYTPDLDLATIAARAFSWDCLDHVRRFGLYAFAQPLFPSSVLCDLGGRLQVRETAWSQLPFGFWTWIGVVTALVGAALTLGSLRRVLSREARKNRVWVMALALVGFLLAAYLAIIVCGRMNVRPSSNILQMNSYYAYTPLLLGLIVCGVCWQVGMPSRGAGWQIATWLQIVLLLSLSYCAGNGTAAMSLAYAEFTSGRTLALKIQQFVVLHRHEPGFGIALDMVQGRVKGIPCVSALFKRYENNDHPTYVVSARGPQVVFTPLDDYLRNNPRTTRPLFPDLVKVGSKYHIFRFAGQYQAIRYGESTWEIISTAPTAAEAEAGAERYFARNKSREPAAK